MAAARPGPPSPGRWGGRRVRTLVLFLVGGIAALGIGLVVLLGPGGARAEVGSTEPPALSTDHRGWVNGKSAVRLSGYAEMMAPPAPEPPVSLDVPLIGMDGSAPDLAELVERRTAIFYFSPSCPHCRAVGHDLRGFFEQQREDTDFLAVGTGGSDSGGIAAFMKEFQLDFPAYKDITRRLGRSLRATSTPTLVIVEPLRAAKEAGSDSVEFGVLEAFRPFAPSSALIASMRASAASGESPFTALEPGQFYGARVCGSCHREELASWALSHHSTAYWTLYERKEAENPKCIGCHVTGFEQPNGFKIGDHESLLTDVTCESCHSAGGPHAGHRQTKDELQQVCVTCHDADHSIAFEYERAIPHIDHYAASVLDPAEFRARREALMAGNAPRPLLAFPEGRNLGSDACAACHPAQHKQWRKSPHGKALKTLKAKGSDKDPACVACHATAKVDVPSTASDYHAGGVGCESCHGPGEKHVAAGGGSENIVGLGSSCPECVIEGICTTCHDAQQDPDWDLKRDLPKVHH